MSDTETDVLGKEFKKSSNILLKTDSDASLRKRCKRIIYRNKYERNPPEIRSWWDKLFQILEEDVAIPPENQTQVLREIFPFRLFAKLLSILSTQDRKFKEELETVSVDSLFKRIKKDFSTPCVVRTDKAGSSRSIWDSTELKVLAAEMSAPVEENFFEKNIDAAPGSKTAVTKSAMYRNFFRRDPKRAAVWRTLPPLSLDEMNLNQKADAITEKIATDFIEWLRDLGGDEELSLDVEAVIAMFEIGFHANSATSLKVEVKEMPSVPKKVADARHLPDRAKRAVLHNQIKKDMRASLKKTTYVAFGGRLPSDMQVRPPAENYYKKWMSCDKVPEKLSSMAAVWQGITHLKSTRAFCEFLIERPEVKPPKYLWDCGMLNLKYLMESDEKSDNISFEFSLPNIFSQ